MGLLHPKVGRILVDGHDLHDVDVPERLMAGDQPSHVPCAFTWPTALLQRTLLLVCPEIRSTWPGCEKLLSKPR